MVLAYHLIITAYGFWLPNDPRGSWSDFVRSWELRRFGPATKVTTRRSVAAKPHDYRLRRQAKSALKYPCVHFTGIQARSIAYGFNTAVSEAGYVIHGCSILPEHVHLIVARHERNIELIARHLKAKATRQLTMDKIQPLAEFRQADGSSLSPWGRRCWKVYLDDHEGVHRAIRYVEQNPTKEHKPPQRWSFVVPLAE